MSPRTSYVRGSMWPELEDRRLKDPDRQLLDAIAAGELDEHLVAIADAVCPGLPD